MIYLQQKHIKTIMSSYLDILEEDPSPPLVLLFHQLLSMLALLLRLMTEELAKVVQCLVIPVEEVSLQGENTRMLVIKNQKHKFLAAMIRANG